MGHTNVGEAAFLDDDLFLDDYKRDVEGFEDDIRACYQDAAPESVGALVVAGGFIAEGEDPDTFVVSAGTRARDKSGLPCVLAAAATVAAVDADGGWNYVALKHAWAYSASRPAYDTSASYYACRADDCQVIVASTLPDEDDGYVNLGKVKKLLGVWTFDYKERSHDRALYGEGLALYLSSEDITAAGIQLTRQCSRLSPLFSWVDKVVLFQLADSQPDTTAALPLDLQAAVRVTETWTEIGTLVDTGGNTRTISVKCFAGAPTVLCLKSDDGTVNVRGMITLLGGAYNAGGEIQP